MSSSVLEHRGERIGDQQALRIAVERLFVDHSFVGLLEFLGGGCTAASESWLVWYRPPSLWMTVLWGEPSEAEVQALVRIFDFPLDGRMAPTYLSLIDCSAIERIDGLAFRVLATYLSAHKADFHRRLARQALVRPGGLVGAVVAGTLATLEYDVPAAVFTDPGAALHWLAGEEGDAAAAELAQRVARERHVAPVIREVRALVEANLSLELADAARLLARSARTLQRQLEEAATSFRAVRIAARMTRAQRLLIESDTKITAIGLDVGCGSLQHFVRMFRSHAGMTPLAFRERYRRADNGSGSHAPPG